MMSIDRILVVLGPCMDVDRHDPDCLGIEAAVPIVLAEIQERDHRIAALERGLAEALTLLDEVTEDTPGRVHAIRRREIKAALLP